jgi:xanthine dehydrogenase molybdenum-binding subunit
MSFAILQLADEIAEELGYEDPMTFVKKTRIQVGEECDTVDDTPGCKLSSCGLDECIDKGAEAIGWAEKWKGWKTPVAVDGVRRTGIGMAALVHDSGLPWMVSGAVLKINMDGTADYHTPVTEIGNGAVTNVIFSDTEMTPLDPMGQVCSSTAHVRSLAAKKAGEDTRRQLLDRAAKQMNESPENLDIEESRIYVKSDPGKYITVKELMMQTFYGGVIPIVGRGTASCPNWPQRAFNYGAHFALVRVNISTGEIEVLKYVAAHDVGKALNFSAVQGQIQGGVAHGLGQAFSEALVFDEKGRPRNNNCTDYKILTSADCPEVVPIIVESDDPVSAYGAKGFAEAPTVGVPACIANAIYNAIGIRFNSLPMNPEKVLIELGKL